MEEARTHRRRTVTKSPLGKFTRLLSRLYLLVTLIFMGLLCYSQFLTTKTLIIVAVALFVAFLLIFPALHSYRFKKSRKFICILLALIMGGSMCVASVYIVNTLLFFDKITSDSSGKDRAEAKRVDVSEEPFNILITGLDVEGDISQSSRSDVNMRVTVNPKTRMILLTSLPSDFYIEYPDVEGEYDKLTHSGIYGADETVASVEKLTGLEMNYYVKVNYSTVKSMVNSIGGIDVNSDFDFETHGQAYYKFVKGYNHMNGEEALAFARERKSFEDGDFQRNRNQQKVMKAMIKKVTSPKVLLLKYPDILNSVKSYMEVNMNSSDIKALVRMQSSGLKGWTVTTQNMKGDIDLKPCYALGGEYASVVVPDSESVNKAVDKIIEVMSE